MRYFGSIFLLTLATLLALTSPAIRVDAQNKIEITVNDEAITSYDLEQRTKLLQLTIGAGVEEARELATEELINERLKTKESKRVGISVSQDRIDDAFAAISERTGMTPEELVEALAFAGVTPSTLRNRLEADIAWSDTVRLRFRRTITIRDEDVIAALQDNPNDEDSDSERTTQYDLTQFMFIVPKNSDEDFKAQREREVIAFRNRFTSCSEGSEFAEGLEEVVIKQIGKKLESELSFTTIDLIRDVPVGKISRALINPIGIELIAVCGKEVIDSNAAAIAEKKNELSNKEGQLMARRYLSELRRTAIIDHRQ